MRTRWKAWAAALVVAMGGTAWAEPPQSDETVIRSVDAAVTPKVVLPQPVWRPSPQRTSPEPTPSAVSAVVDPPPPLEKTEKPAIAPPPAPAVPPPPAPVVVPAVAPPPTPAVAPPPAPVFVPAVAPADAPTSTALPPRTGIVRVSAAFTEAPAVSAAKPACKFVPIVRTGGQVPTGPTLEPDQPLPSPTPIPPSPVPPVPLPSSLPSPAPIAELHSSVPGAEVPPAPVAGPGCPNGGCDGKHAAPLHPLLAWFTYCPHTYCGHKFEPAPYWPHLYTFFLDHCHPCRGPFPVPPSVPPPEPLH
jgi:hypothetical protein